MKKIITVLILMLLLTGCNKREDVSHKTPEEMTKYANKIIDEEVEFIDSTDDKSDTVIYTYKLVDRDIVFHFKSSISAISIDGSQFSNYKEKITTDYEYAIAYSDYYKEKRSELANEYNINESIVEEYDGMTYYAININDYDDLENLINYYIAVDELYSFKEKKPNKVADIRSNEIYTNNGISFSVNSYTHTKKDNINFKKAYSNITFIYKKYIEEAGKVDPKIPN